MVLYLISMRKLYPKLFGYTWRWKKLIRVPKKVDKTSMNYFFKKRRGAILASWWLLEWEIDKPMGWCLLLDNEINHSQRETQINLFLPLPSIESLCLSWQNLFPFLLVNGFRIFDYGSGEEIYGWGKKITRSFSSVYFKKFITFIELCSLLET